MSFQKSSFGAFSALSLILLASSFASASATKDSIRVNCGGNAYTDSAGNQWVADSGFTGGQTYSATSTIANTPDQALHQDERWDSQDFSYNFNVNPGTYSVRLHNASLFASVCNAGGRVFDVTINNTKVLTNYDMFNEVGCLFAQIKTFTVSTTSNGKINITFNVGTASNPKINAIEVLYLNATVTGIQGQSKANAGDSKLSFAASAGGFTANLRAEGAYTLEVSDLQGKRIGFKQGIGAGAQSFTNMNPGLYFVTLRSGAKSYSRAVSVLR